MIRRKFTIVEGWTFSQTLKALQQAPMLTHRFTALTPGQVATALQLASASPEGLFYPSTYEYTYGMSDETLLKRAHLKMEEKLSHYWKLRSIGLSYKTPYQALIVASMIEKESSVISEKPMIASVILKRLAIRMPLQIDPTVIYGLGDLYDGRLNTAELRTDTPYNTYMHYGLPPTPICMPSESSIQAALNPAVSNALYYVATGKGGHYFSATYQEHQQAVKRYLSVEKKDEVKIHHP